MAPPLSYWNHTTVRELERASIRDFVERAASDGYLCGRVLDFGCGRQPYRDVVEANGGFYHGYDRAGFPANVSGEDVGELPNAVGLIDAILCNQVVQYVPQPIQLLRRFRLLLRQGGYLVMTYPTCWDEVEPADLHRFTRWGIDRLLTDVGFEVVRHERRADIELHGFRFPLGGGVVASSP